MLLLMFIGGAAQSTAGGVKVNAFAAAVLSLFAVIRGKSRVEVFRRQLSVDSIRRSNATLVMYLMILFLGVFVRVCSNRMLRYWPWFSSVLRL